MQRKLWVGALELWVTHMAHKNDSAALALLLGYRGVDLAVGDAGGDFITDFHRVGVLEQLAVGIEDEGVSAIQHGKRRQ